MSRIHDEFFVNGKEAHKRYVELLEKLDNEEVRHINVRLQRDPNEFRIHIQWVPY